jgi:hypothetical protein
MAKQESTEISGKSQKIGYQKMREEWPEKSGKSD